MSRRALILVSASPRRSHLLRQAGLDFSVQPADVDESPLPGEAPGDLAARLARAKVRALPAPPGPALAIAADTVVAIDGTILGKPRDPADARRMLGLLSGRTHHVITAVALRALPEESLVSERAESLVTFVPMTAEEIAWYAATGEGMDKAGAYALQGIGALFIASIEGSYTNVIGLPLERLHPHLRRYGLIEPASSRRS
ncbi:MAG TPA: Maf family protein [Candidatus Polarisedimenticolia bacterium]|jgi:septum formation protein|nr:Maf family protein [Candidatus Polarisedimenticolia bacterium]